LAERYHWTGNIQDLETGIAILEEAVTWIPDTHFFVKTPAIYTTLGALLLWRHERIGAGDDSIQGATFLKKAAEMTTTEQANPNAISARVAPKFGENLLPIWHHLGRFAFFSFVTI
jgi:hypothetical protein